MNKKIYWMCLGILAMSNQSNSFPPGGGGPYDLVDPWDAVPRKHKKILVRRKKVAPLPEESEPLLAQKSPQNDLTQEKEVVPTVCIDEMHHFGKELNQLLAVFYRGDPQTCRTLEQDKSKRKELDSVLKEHIALLRAHYPDKTNKELWNILLNEPLRANGETILHHAAHRLDTYFVAYLLRHGARADKTMQTGALPIDTARSRFLKETQDPQPKIVEEWKPTKILIKRGNQPIAQESTLVQKVVPPVYNIEKQQALTKRYLAIATLLTQATQKKPTLGQRISRIFKR